MATDPNARENLQAAAAQRMQDNQQTTAERSLWQGRYSPKAMYGTWVISAIVTLVAIAVVATFFRDKPMIWPILGAILLFWWTIAIGGFLYRRLSVHYELTTQKFVHQAGLLVRRTDRIEMLDIDDVSYTQGIIQRMLGVGTIRLTSSDRTHPELIVSGIDKVPEIAGLIDDVRREERRRRAVHIETV